MIITIIILALACILLAVYSIKGNSLTKNILQTDKNISSLIISLNDSVGQTSPSDKHNNEKIILDLADAYNKHAELDDDVIEYHGNIILMAIVTAVIGLIALLAVII